MIQKMAFDTVREKSLKLTNPLAVSSEQEGHHQEKHHRKIGGHQTKQHHRHTYAIPLQLSIEASEPKNILLETYINHQQGSQHSTLGISRHK